MGKHAYLIMAHNNFSLLQKKLMLLDDERNDIFIHIDKNTKDVDFAYIMKKVRYSQVFFIPRMKIKWGGYSIAQCTINLLKAAMKEGSYQYYHLLSGADLPIKTQDEIHEFFQREDGKEFVSFDQIQPREQDIRRVKRYYFFQDRYGREYKRGKYFFLYLIDMISLKVQDFFKVDRFKGQQIELQKGPEWFSITHQLAKLVVEREEWIRKQFIHTRCCDEVFIQTVVNNSERKAYLYQNGLTREVPACLRKIDWGRGKPYTWTVKEYEELINSKCLFARKFDPSVDEEIISKLMEHLTQSV